MDEKFHTKLKELNIIFDKKTTSSELVDLEDSGLQYNSVTEDTIKNWLYHIDNNIDNSQWVKVGMALHNWNDILGLQLWEDWSKGGDTYKIGETEKRWRSFKKNKGITAGTLFHIAKLSISLNKLKICKFVEQLEDLADEMNNLPKDTHGIFKYEFKLNYEKLTGKEITSEELEKLLTKNAWYSNWIFVNTHDSYLDLRNFTIHKTKSFNQENNHRIPSLGKGPKELASNYVANENLIRKVNKIEYRPDKEELIFTENNQSILNSFDRSLLPVAKDEYTPGGLKAIELIKNI